MLEFLIAAGVGVLLVTAFRAAYVLDRAGRRLVALSAEVTRLEAENAHLRDMVARLSPALRHDAAHETGIRTVGHWRRESGV